jgi:hypothetical protein
MSDPAYPGIVARPDEKTLRDALEAACVVIDAEDFERSRRDPRVRELFDGGEALLAELEAMGANR